MTDQAVAPRARRRRPSLWGYAASRLATTLLVIVGAIALLFVVTLFVPGDLATILLGPRATPAAVAAYAHKMGLDLPVHERLFRFFFQLLQGDLGSDVVTGRPILDMVLEVLPHTLALAASAIGLGVLLGLPLGCYAATHRGSLGDQVTAVLSVGLIATPTFVVAVYLLLIFSIWLRWLPVIGAGEPGDIGDALLHLVLPATALALGWIGYIARLIRSSLLEVLEEPYLRTARAYGMARWRVLFKYALKLACIPTVAILGLGVADLLSGAVFVEIVFARPGIGTLIYGAIRDRNYPVVQGGVLAVVVLFVLANLLVDLSYGWLDPRVRRDLGKSGR
jgi:peptide/nickel transport system permease protein